MATVDDLIRKIRREALEKSDSLETAPKKEPLPQAPWELWPGENTELGGFLLAKIAKQRAKYRRGRNATA